MRNYACSAFTTEEKVMDWGCSCLVEGSESDVIDDAIDAASDVLVILSGFRVNGICTKTVRPMSNSWCGHSDSYWSGAPVMFNGLQVIPLPGPDATVTQVKVDGVVLETSEYGLIDGMYLFRREGSFPSSNDLALATTEVGTWSITFTYGRAIDFITETAASELACAFAASMLGQKSTLPPGVVGANIQGVSIVVDRETRDDPGSLPAVARFLDVYAPNGRNLSGVIFPELDHGWSLVEIS